MPVVYIIPGTWYVLVVLLLLVFISSLKGKRYIMMVLRSARQGVSVVYRFLGTHHPHVPRPRAPSSFSWGFCGTCFLLARGGGDTGRPYIFCIKTHIVWDHGTRAESHPVWYSAQKKCWHVYNMQYACDFFCISSNTHINSFVFTTTVRFVRCRRTSDSIRCSQQPRVG